MNEQVRQIADAVLYEGYILWPYTRSATKNAQRWTFGGVYPPRRSAEHPDDRDEIRCECLLEGDGDVDVTVRFLQIVRRDPVQDGQRVRQAVERKELCAQCAKVRLAKVVLNAERDHAVPIRI